MRKDWKYIVYVSLAVALYVSVKLLSPKQFDWSVTLAHDDKDPYGTFALDQLLPGIFRKEPIVNSYQTLYELKDSLQEGSNIIILASDLTCEKEDTDVLLDHVSKGGTAFISAQNFRGHLADTLNLKLQDHFFSKDIINIYESDSAYLKFANPRSDTTQRYSYRKENIAHYFKQFDSTRTTIIAKNNYGRPVTLRMPWGKGNLILNSTPIVFTNIYVLAKQNHNFVSTTLSYLPDEKIFRTELYHLGRMESRTPLRFILTHEPLTWAYYLVMGALILFMLFEAKRKQRIIPIVKPPANTSLEFVATIGNLYYQNGDHRNMAEKQISFLLDQIRTKYLLKTSQFDDEFITAVASKSGNKKEDVQDLFRTISLILSATMISAEQLMDLNNKIEDFNAVKGKLETTT
jgi:hypothetical protein